MRVISSKVPKDIRIYKTKVVGPFTIRQALIIAVACVVEVILVQLLFRPLALSGDMMFFLVFLTGLPIMSFAVIEPEGMPLEKYLGILFRYFFLVPSKRKSKNQIPFEEKKAEVEGKKKGKEKKKAKKKKKRKNGDGPKAYK